MKFCNLKSQAEIPVKAKSSTGIRTMLKSNHLAAVTSVGKAPIEFCKIVCRSFTLITARPNVELINYQSYNDFVFETDLKVILRERTKSPNSTTR